jgi:beta-galactosidase
MYRRRLIGGAAAVLGSALLPGAAARARGDAAAAPARFSIGASDFLLDGQPLQIRCGEMHFARVPRAYWRHRLQAIKAMGLNTVCAYLFWNYHEWREGRFDWDGERDAAAFCRIAQEEGLWVILRPGPYACAEWEMGGLPWWLLKHPGDAFLRTRAAAFVVPAQRWLREVGRVLGPLQVTRGGPILMVQVENEYGFFGSDLDYLRTMRRAVLDAGFDVPLFQCNPTNALAKTHVPELLSVANFGSDPAAGFKALGALQRGPLMCGEYYSGWFDTWGAPHRRGAASAAVADITAMLKANGSFSLYMAHGGTTFGLWGGCDRPFRPDTTSYDYDAPIGEAGWTGEKFAAYRAGIAPFLAGAEVLPPAPARNGVIAIAPFALTERAGVLANMPRRALRAVSPQPIEQYDISRGLVAYRVTLGAGAAGVLAAAKVRDLAWVTVDGAQVGTFDTRLRRFAVAIAARSRPVTVEILVYTIARVNFGVEVHDRKGLHGPVTFTPQGAPAQRLEQWEIRAMDFDADGVLPALAWRAAPAQAGARTQAGAPTPAPAREPAFWRGHATVDEPGDTFLDMSTWGQGVVWVNGRCLGRYWSIGPTQTMYLPGPWLRRGRNEVVVLDLTGPSEARLAGLTMPILDQLRPERDLARPASRVRLQLEGAAPLREGEFAPGAASQDVLFAAAVTARQFCLESVSAFDGGSGAAVAEIALLDRAGNALNQSAWTIAYASSEEMERIDGSALNAINGQVSDYWHSAYSGAAAGTPHPHPHRLVIDLGRQVEVACLRYTPRQGAAGVTGRIRQYRLYVGDALVVARP